MLNICTNVTTTYAQATPGVFQRVHISPVVEALHHLVALAMELRSQHLVLCLTFYINVVSRIDLSNAASLQALRCRSTAFLIWAAWSLYNKVRTKCCPRHAGISIVTDAAFDGATYTVLVGVGLSFASFSTDFDSRINKKGYSDKPQTEKLTQICQSIILPVAIDGWGM